MAHAGFYYEGQGDSVRCYSCGLRLSDWKTNDDPVARHMHASPACKHVNSLVGPFSVIDDQITADPPVTSSPEVVRIARIPLGHPMMVDNRPPAAVPAAALPCACAALLGRGPVASPSYGPGLCGICNRPIAPETAVASVAKEVDVETLKLENLVRQVIRSEMTRPSFYPNQGGCCFSQLVPLFTGRPCPQGADLATIIDLIIRGMEETYEPLSMDELNKRVQILWKNCKCGQHDRPKSSLDKLGLCDSIRKFLDSILPERLGGGGTSSLLDRLDKLDLLDKSTDNSDDSNHDDDKTTPCPSSDTSNIPFRIPEKIRTVIKAVTDN